MDDPPFRPDQHRGEHAARARERYKVASVKDDRFDAFVLADTLRYEHKHWRPLAVPSALLAEIKALTRDRDRLRRAREVVSVGKVSGVVGTYAAVDPFVEEHVCRELDLAPAEATTPASADR